jgi:DNA repair protein RecO (recombination protein O)
MAVLDLLMTTGWPPAYLRWELDLLEELGFGLDLTTCAVTGSREDLAYVSPRTGRAVSRAAAGDWAARLLPLPPALLGQGPATAQQMAQGLALTGHFLNRGLQAVLGDKPLPEARARLIDLLSRG